MVARGIELPNIRKIFVPDPGYVVVDMDLSGADAQVVAWEADDADLKGAFRAGIKIHAHNLRTMFPQYAHLTDKQIKSDHGDLQYLYDRNKRAVHATNFGGSAPGVAKTIKWPVRQMEEFQSRWFTAHPGIGEWHERINRHLEGTECWNCYAPSIGTPRCDNCGRALGRTVKNRFGYRIIYYDRVGPSMWREALGWIPQSTVAIVTRKALIILDKEFSLHSFILRRANPTAIGVEPLVQVHDSLVFQVPFRGHQENIERIKSRLDRIAVPYPDPLYIPWGISSSDKSWGDCED